LYPVQFCFWSIFWLSYMSAGMKGSGGGAPPSSRLARRRRGFFRSCHPLIRVHTVWINKQQQQNQPNHTKLCNMFESPPHILESDDIISVNQSIGTIWKVSILPFQSAWILEGQSSSPA
jgi:hypothetical protein